MLGSLATEPVEDVADLDLVDLFVRFSREVVTCHEHRYLISLLTLGAARVLVTFPPT